MKRVLVALGTMAAVAAAGGLLACSGILGISAATQEPADSGTVEAAAVDAGNDAGLCGTYCALMDKNCNWNNPGTFGEYFNIDVCLAMCPVFDTSGPISASNTDTLGCRTFYAQKAGSDPAMYCSAAGLLGGGVCGTTPCIDFCGADVPYCAPISPSYASEDDCLAACQDGGFPYVKEDGGDINGVDKGNTLNCRTWHLNNAYVSTSNAKFHCQHTEQNSGPCSGPRPDGGTFVP